MAWDFREPKKEIHIILKTFFQEMGGTFENRYRNRRAKLTFDTKNNKLIVRNKADNLELI